MCCVGGRRLGDRRFFYLISAELRHRHYATPSLRVQIEIVEEDLYECFARVSTVDTAGDAVHNRSTVLITK